jgi:hypothetical protein
MISIFRFQLVLVPDINSVSIFQGARGRSRLNDFTRFRCEDANLPANVPRPSVHPVCRKLQFSGSAVIYDGAIRKLTSLLLSLLSGVNMFFFDLEPKYEDKRKTHLHSNPCYGLNFED